MDVSIEQYPNQTVLGPGTEKKLFVPPPIRDRLHVMVDAEYLFTERNEKTGNLNVPLILSQRPCQQILFEIGLEL